MSILGPIGNGFSPDSGKPRKLLLGGGVGIPPMVFLAEHLRSAATDLTDSLVVMGSELPFPFEQVPSELTVAGVPDDITNTMPDMEMIQAPTRLASLQGFPGCLQGYVTDLAALWLDAIGTEGQREVEVFACGPEPMLAAAAALAERYDLPCQLALEEFMACAVGGCAGCTVPVHSDAGVAMKRVCVDGPVFPAEAIYPATS